MHERLKQARITLKLTQEQFGKHLGISRSAVTKLESGENKITDQHLIILKSEFNISEDWIRFGENEMFKATNSSIEYLLGKYCEDLSDEQIVLIKSILKMTKQEREALTLFVSRFKSEKATDE